MDYLEIKAPAKINVGLNIVSKRQDGFHNLETVFYPLYELSDTIFFQRSECFSFSSDDEELNNGNNLIIRAKDLLEEQTGRVFNVDIRLEKTIPTGAGLGGGSSDAATTLISLNEMFSLGFRTETLQKFALQLGSDVPFFIRSKPSFASGRGEVLEQIELKSDSYILVVNAGIHISTKEAYQNVIPAPAEFSLKLLDGLSLDDGQLLRRMVKNDFENYAFSIHPVLRDIKNQLYGLGAHFALMTGSGSSVFGIFSRQEDAEEARDSFPKEYFTCICS